MKNKWIYPKKIDQIHFTEDNQQKVLNQINSPPQRKRSKKRLYGTIAAAIVFLLFGSVIFVPDIENVLAKIPYISQFIKDEEQRMEQMQGILAEVNLIVEENGMEIGDLQIQIEDKKAKVHLIGLSGKSNSLAKQINSQLEKEGYTGYDVKVVAYEETEIQTKLSNERLEKNIQDSKALEAALIERLKAQGYELMFPVSVQNNAEGIYVNVIVPKSENRFEQLEEIMKEEAQVYGDEYRLDIRQVQKIAREQEKRWQKTGALGHIGRALMEAEILHVTGFAHSFHPYPLQIKVKTSLELGDPKTIQIAKDISSEIDLFIQTDKETEMIRDDVYNVKVISKDKKEIDIE